MSINYEVYSKIIILINKSIVNSIYTFIIKNIIYACIIILTTEIMKCLILPFNVFTLRNRISNDGI